MTVKRIVSNIATSSTEAAQAFYGDIFDMEIRMDFGWITTYGAAGKAPVLLSIATEGGSGTEVPDLSIEVDNLEEVQARLEKAGIPIVYGPADEPWGVRRFYVHDPFGKLVNVLAHMPAP
jgi:catechol 2,3-dioxygenase-like lactoylglutathione lyase family enzyme